MGIVAAAGQSMLGYMLWTASFLVLAAAGGQGEGLERETQENVLGTG
jgi:hypothetical protein